MIKFDAHEIKTALGISEQSVSKSYILETAKRIREENVKLSDFVRAVLAEVYHGGTQKYMSVLSQIHEWAERDRRKEYEVQGGSVVCPTCGRRQCKLEDVRYQETDRCWSCGQRINYGE